MTISLQHLLLILAGLAPQSSLAQDGIWIIPPPTGPYIPGTIDFQFEVNFQGSFDVMKLMGRAWYPSTCTQESTCLESSSWTKDLNFEEGEAAALGRLPEGLDESFLQHTTNSYKNAPALQSQPPNGFVVFSHGATGAITDHQGLMEEIASQGYVAIAIAHPGMASGVLYPDGGTVEVDDDFLHALGDYDFIIDAYMQDNITKRYEDRKLYATGESDLLNYATYYTEDQLFFVNYLEEQRGTNSTLGMLVSASPSPISVAYMGYSIGGGIVGSTALQDPEHAKCAINLDGAHQHSDLLGEKLPPAIPYLYFTVAPRDNEFFFHKLYSETAGSISRSFQTSNDVFRFTVVSMNSTDFTDAIYLPEDFRSAFGGSTIDAQLIDNMLRSFTVAFLHYCFDESPGRSFDVASLLAAHPIVEKLDLSYVQEWGNIYFGVEPVYETPAEPPTDAPSVSSECVRLNPLTWTRTALLVAICICTSVMF